MSAKMKESLETQDHCAKSQIIFYELSLDVVIYTKHSCSLQKRKAGLCSQGFTLTTTKPQVSGGQRLVVRYF